MKKARAVTPTYQSWKGAKQRCSDPNHTAWLRYGGRGITFCQRWGRFAQFLADMGERPEGMTLDRIDNDKGYEPGNCRWATRTEQSRNTAHNVRHEFRGQLLCLIEIAELTGVDLAVIRMRVKRGWTLQEAAGDVPRVRWLHTKSKLPKPPRAPKPPKAPKVAAVKAPAPIRPKPVPAPVAVVILPNPKLFAFRQARARLEAEGLTADEIANRVPRRDLHRSAA